MQEDGMRKAGSEASDELLFKGVCPVRALRPRAPHSYRIREDWKIYYQGAWRTIANVIERRRENRARSRRNHRLNPAKERERGRKWRERYLEREPEEPKNSPTPRTERGGPESLSGSEPRSESGETATSLPVLSIGQLLSTEEVKLISMNCVDDAISRLSKQMRRLAPLEEEKQEDEGSDLMRAQTACLTAASLAKLVKLKVDVVRPAHDIHKGGTGAAGATRP